VSEDGPGTGYRVAATGTAPDDPELADAAARWRSAYVHIPFCRRRCPYCDFAVVTPSETDRPVEAYVDAVIAEIAMEPEWGALDAVNLGGGTPSTLDPASLRRILTALGERFGLNPGAEVSIETNPEDVTPALAEALVATGFTRISLGVQSFDAAVLGVLGRRHDRRQAETAVAAVRGAGFGSVSIDLIFGAAGETQAMWRATLAAALALAPDHLSAYGLTVEPGTALSRQVAAGGPRPDPDVQADAYEHLVAAVAGTGLVHYEVSNFAAPGHVCRYNLSTWAQGEYLAFGLGAHGHRDGVRRRNVRRLEAYLDRIAAGNRPEAGTVRQDDWGREQERVLLGIRRRAGVVAGVAGTAVWESGEGERLGTAGVLRCEGERLVVTRPLLTDAVSRAVLSLSPGEC
jgi:putative oxygen-independent coproporphyrinogen III oxidase